jgi:hypothetical protein
VVECLLRPHINRSPSASKPVEDRRFHLLRRLSAPRALSPTSSPEIAECGLGDRISYQVASVLDAEGGSSPIFDIPRMNGISPQIRWTNLMIYIIHSPVDCGRCIYMCIDCFFTSAPRSSCITPDMDEIEKSPQNGISQQQSIEAVSWVDGNAPRAPNDNLNRGLKPRHLTMIALGGTLGTGLLIGTYV